MLRLHEVIRLGSSASEILHGQLKRWVSRGLASNLRLEIDVAWNLALARGQSPPKIPESYVGSSASLHKLVGWVERKRDPTYGYGEVVHFTTSPGYALADHWLWLARSLDSVVNVLPKPPPMALTDPMITIEISAVIRPYSTAVAPRSSRMNRLRVLRDMVDSSAYFQTI